MNTLIVCDIDGCLNSGKDAPLDLPVLGEIKQEIERLERAGKSFTLCTGRPQPYAEAICRLLNVTVPLICENGALIFHPDTDKTENLVPEKQRSAAQLVRTEIEAMFWFGEEAFFEPGKEVCLSITGPFVVEKSHAELDVETAKLSTQFEGLPLDWNHSSSAIDITPEGINKGYALDRLVELLKFDGNSLVGIGDSSGDMPFLQKVHRVLCPDNASDNVKALASYTSPHDYAAGTLDALRQL